MNDRLRVRQRFLAAGTTTQILQRDYPEWRRGRTRYAFWAIDLEDAAVGRQVAAAERHLADLLLAGYCRKAHVTVRVCGFPCAIPEHADDFAPAHLAAQLAAMQSACRQPFAIVLGALDSFSTAPIFPIDDPESGIARLRDCLSVADAGPGEVDFDYHPHVTLGHYAGAWPSVLVGQRLDAFAHGGAIRCRVDRLSLMTYQAAEIGGALTILADFHFATGHMHWRQASPFLAGPERA